MSQLDDAYAAQVRIIRARVEGFAQAQFAAGEYRDADLKRFVKTVVPVILAGRRQTSTLTDAYLSRLLSDSLGRPVKPQGPVDTDSLRGVDASEVYVRPYKSVWMELAEGKALGDAAKAGTARLTDLVLSDLQLAKTHTARNVFSNTAGVAGFRRVLTGRKSCALCYVASTHRYNKSDLLPCHPGCDCSVAPILADDRAKMGSQLEATHEAVEDRFGVSDRGARKPDYRQIQVQQHGEMGPILTVRGQAFTAESDLPRT